MVQRSVSVAAGIVTTVVLCASSAYAQTATCIGGSADFNGDGDVGTDADIEAFFACLAGNCCATCGSADFNADGDIGTDADIEDFFRVLGGGTILSTSGLVTILNGSDLSLPASACIHGLDPENPGISSASFVMAYSSLGDQFPGQYPVGQGVSSPSHDFRVWTPSSLYTLDSLLRDGAPALSAQSALIQLTQDIAAYSALRNLETVWSPAFLTSIGIPATDQEYIREGRDPVHNPGAGHLHPITISILESLYDDGASINLTDNTLMLYPHTALGVAPGGPVGSGMLDDSIVASELSTLYALIITQPQAGQLRPEGNFGGEWPTTASACIYGDVAQCIGAFLYAGGLDHGQTMATPNGPEVFREFAGYFRLTNQIPYYPDGAVPVANQMPLHAGVPMNAPCYYDETTLIENRYSCWPLCTLTYPPVAGDSYLGGTMWSATLLNTVFYRLAMKIGEEPAKSIFFKAFSLTTDQAHLAIQVFAQQIYDAADQLYGATPNGPRYLQAVSRVLLAQGLNPGTGGSTHDLQQHFFGTAIGATVRGFTFATGHPFRKPSSLQTLITSPLPDPNPQGPTMDPQGIYNAYSDTAVVADSPAYIAIQLDAASEIPMGSELRIGPMNGTYVNNLPVGWTSVAVFSVDGFQALPRLADRTVFVPLAGSLNDQTFAFRYLNAYLSGYPLFPYENSCYGFQFKQVVPNGYAYTVQVDTASSTATATSFIFDAYDPSDWGHPVNEPSTVYTYAWTLIKTDGTTVTAAGRRLSVPLLDRNEYISVDLARTPIGGGTTVHVTIDAGVREFEAMPTMVTGQTPATGPIPGSFPVQR